MNLPESLHLWWLANPALPVLVGELRYAHSLRGVSLSYTPQWLANGFALSEDLPLHAGEHLPKDNDSAAGAVDEARPERWGERVTRLASQPARLGLLDHLYWAGDERFGALGVSISAQRYQPRPGQALPRLADLPTLTQAVQLVLLNVPVTPELRPLLAFGAAMGGDRPKALVNVGGKAWLVKFPEPGDVFDTALLEHASLGLAERAGIRVAQSQVLDLPNGQHALAVRRFDRTSLAHRVHCLSAHTALRAAGEPMGYPELAQWLRRHAPAASYRQQMAELFTRMVFNILIDNTDDHEKNHVLMMNDQGRYELAPAFDVLPQAQRLGHQRMRVGRDQTASTLDNALSESSQFGLSLPLAKEKITTVQKAVRGWQDHFAKAGVVTKDLDQLARFVGLAR
ncbi:MAG: type II toxin-antitoxin system HipA family toxin [Hylemonella sp.]